MTSFDFAQGRPFDFAQGRRLALAGLALAIAATVACEGLAVGSAQDQVYRAPRTPDGTTATVSTCATPPIVRCIELPRR